MIKWDDKYRGYRIDRPVPIQDLIARNLEEAIKEFIKILIDYTEKDLAIEEINHLFTIIIPFEIRWKGFVVYKDTFYWHPPEIPCEEYYISGEYRGRYSHDWEKDEYASNQTVKEYHCYLCDSKKIIYKTSNKEKIIEYDQNL